MFYHLLSWLRRMRKCSEVLLTTQFESYHFFQIGNRDLWANNNEKYQSVEGAYNRAQSLSLPIDQDILDPQFDNLLGLGIIDQNIDATDQQSLDVRRTLHRLGLGPAPGQSLVDWIFYGPSKW